MNPESDEKIRIQIKEQINRNQKYIVYDDREYEIDFDLLSKNCNYFYQNRKQFKHIDKIQLITDTDDTPEITIDAVENFIKASQNEIIEIKYSTIYGIRYLSEKYEFEKLTKELNAIIDSKMREHAIDHLLHKIEQEKNSEDKNLINTNEEERIICQNMQKYIHKDEILQLPIQVLYRIIQKYSKKIEKNEIKDNLNSGDMTNFLFKCLDKFGSDASILFTTIDFEKEKIDVISRIIENYSDVFDFNVINSSLAKLAVELTNNVNRIKEEYESNICLMKKELENKEKEIEIMKLNEIKNAEQYSKEKNLLKKQYNDDINEMKNEMNKKIEHIETQFQIMVNEHNQNIDNSLITKYQELIIEMIDFEQFIKLSQDLQKHIISEIYRQTKKQPEKIKINDKNKDLFERILFFIQIFQCKAESNDEELIKSNDENKDLFEKIIFFIQILKRNANINDDDQLINQIGDNMNNLTLFNEDVENLYQKNILVPMINDLMKYYDHLTIVIQYPLNSFDEVLSIVSKEKNKYNDDKKNITIQLKINDGDYFDQYQQPNSSIDIVDIECEIDEIKDKAFYKYDHLNKISIQEGLLKIGNSSFEGCSSLVDITIPSTVTFIGERAFYECISLNEISIPPSVTEIGENCFDECNKLEQIDGTIDPFHINIENDNLPQLTQFVILVINKHDKNDQSKEDITFSSMKTEFLFKNDILASSKFSSHIRKFNEIIFEIQYPSDNFESIYQHASKLKESYPDQVKISINICNILKTDQRFYNNQVIDYVKLDKNVVKIENKNGSFNGCTSLKQISIPSSVTSIGANSFNNCSSLTSITIPSTVTTIKNDAFINCTSLEQVSFENPSSLTSIGTCCFKNCSSLKQISIPSSVTSIGCGSFSQCTALEQISIPSSLTLIGANSFNNCSSLTSITIPSTVTKIEKDAFMNCTSLEQVSFENPSSLTSIGICCFRNCSSLKQISIPASVTSIGWGSFSHCTALEQISIPSSVTSIGVDMFCKCSSLKQISIPSSVTSIRRHAFFGCSSLIEISIPSSVNFIGNQAFFSCPSLKQVSIPLESISKGAFPKGIKIIKI